MRSRDRVPCVLLLEQSAFALEEQLRGVPGAPTELRLERRPWSEPPAGSGIGESVDLIVPVASPEAAQAIALLTWVQANRGPVPALGIVPADAPDDVLRVASESLDDYILWPARVGELRQRLARMLGEQGGETRPVRPIPFEDPGLVNLVGEDPEFLAVLEQIPRVAQGDGTVLITGETGTGKELCARAIHHLGPRRSFPFVPVDCGAVPEHLLENELFGHARGAFTDARSDQKGLAAIAEGGTLFLDEIDALSPPGQGKLLRFLQDRSFRPLGAERFSRADVRVIAATNRDLEGWVREKRFRADLYFRLNVFRLRLIPLRERRADIPLLARHFLRLFDRDRDGAARSFSPAVLRLLEHHAWPGNVRELSNVVERAVAFAEGLQILPCHVSLPPLAEEGGAVPSFRDARARALADFERAYIEELLHRHHGNITRAAREAGKDRRAFGRLVKKHSGISA